MGTDAHGLCFSLSASRILLEMRKPYEEETTYVPGGLTHEENERALRLRIEELCTEFEDNWQPDSVELIQDAAAQIPERLDAILRELIVLDCELLSEHGTEPHLDRYQSLPAAWQPRIHSAFEDSKNSEDGSIASDDPPGIPERIGDYQILREIGRGGMGVIYEAVQESLGRRVAIKTLANMHVSRLAPRFEREARAVARLHHTNIIEVYGTGIHDGVPYFAMQLVEGKSLSEAISNASELLGQTAIPSVWNSPEQLCCWVQDASTSRGLESKSLELCARA